jgi:16S rRNA (uracil1498-N3)-methyltransferase
MPADRFFIDSELKGTLSLEGAELHHLAHVMKVRVGEEVEVVNGRGGLAKAKVVSISKRDAELEVLSSTQTPLPPPLLTLAVPLMRPAKLEIVIEKCTELGADAFWFYPAHYSEKEDLSPHQLDRLNLIAVSAMKQCGRLDLPSIKCLSSFEEIFKSPAAYLFGDTRPGGMLKEAPKRPDGKIVFITGPERGFSEKEVEMLDRKATGVRLHGNILRAETAPIVASVIYSSSTGFEPVA